MRITEKMLRRRAACDAQVDLFKETFPDFPRGVPVTRENLEIAAEAGLEMEWLGHLLRGRDKRNAWFVKVNEVETEFFLATRAAEVAYHEAATVIAGEYVKATRPLRAERDRQLESIRQAFLRTKPIDWGAYEAAAQPILEAYEQAQAPHWAARDAAMKPVSDAYDVAIQPAQAVLNQRLIDAFLEVIE